MKKNNNYYKKYNSRKHSKYLSGGSNTPLYDKITLYVDDIYASLRNKNYENVVKRIKVFNTGIGATAPSAAPAPAPSAAPAPAAAVAEPAAAPAAAPADAEAAAEAEAADAEAAAEAEESSSDSEDDEPEAEPPT